uniref:Uncharacterized protein n=1 Tax=Oryza rufipogon TaxID=4529 RepID=A0A0E0QF51_ORYRU
MWSRVLACWGLLHPDIRLPSIHRLHNVLASMCYRDCIKQPKYHVLVMEGPSWKAVESEKNNLWTTLHWSEPGRNDPLQPSDEPASESSWPVNHALAQRSCRINQT